ncbi:MAG: hypothetical protein EAZ16_09875 [Sphingobacteriales bacterium]|jgi:hypothetical protein|nr:MAG: hypothetical protein EAZ16_09875 [Sphingobacteriales bacterium]
MTTRATILNELKELSPVVAGINPQTPYQVPVGYFEQLSAQVLNAVKEDIVSDVLSKENVFNVPAGYFEELSGVVMNRIKATEAKDSAEELQHLSPLLSSLSKTQPYSLPKGYFEELGGNVVAGVQAIEFVNEELENLSPLMSELKQVNVFTVPATYFNELPVAVLNKVKQPAKVISISFTRKVMRLAAAACVAGLIGFAGWIYFANNNTTTPQNDVVAAATELQETEKTILNTASDEAIENFIEGNTTPVTDESAIALADITAENTQDLFADVTDAQLQEYLEETGVNTQIMNN